MGTIRRYANGFRVQIYGGLHPETGKEIRPSRYLVAPDNRAGRKKAEAALAQLIVDHEHQPIAPKAALGTVADLFDRWLASHGLANESGRRQIRITDPLETPSAPSQASGMVMFMTADSVTFRLDGEVEVEKLARAFAQFTAVLNELPKAHDAAVRWVVTGLEYGSALATAQAVPVDDLSAPFVPSMIEDFMAAAEGVSRGESDESRPLLKLVRDLTMVADEANPLILETEAAEVLFAQPATPAEPSKAAPGTKSIGTVRGRVETLMHRGKLRFTLFDLTTNRAVSCYLPEQHEDLMRDAWGRVADVTGTVTRDPDTGRALSIRKVTDIAKVEEGNPLGFLEAEGAIGGTEPAETVIRRVRDAS